MISRRSTATIADIYNKYFTSIDYSTSSRSIRPNLIRLYDFLYEEGFPAWILEDVRRLPSYTSRGIKDFILKFHTGQSMVSGTPNWSWHAREKLGQQYLQNMAESALNLLTRDATISRINNADIELLKSQLELDGYIYRDNKLYQVDAGAIATEDEQNYLELLLTEVGISNLEIVKHHMKLASDHFINKNWDDSIGNSRKFFEEILKQTANTVNKQKTGNNLANETLESPRLVRNFLEGEGLLEQKEKQAIAKIYSLLSDTGSHPYIAEKDQARLMRQLGLMMGQFVLLRLQNYIK